jgi:hypothetical protein
MNLPSNRHISFILVGILLILLFLGYTYYADAEAIQNVYAEIEGINQINAKITSAAITFTINITNPSNRNVNQLSSTFDIYIEDTFVGTGSFFDHDIPAQTSNLKQVQINVNYGGLADSSIDILKNWFVGQDSQIKIKGVITASVLFGLTTTSHKFIAISS